MSESISTQILSDITVYMKYARYLPELKRRETWDEIVERNKRMHVSKFPELQEEIENTFQFVTDKKVLPSMRSMQFAGKPIEVSPNRIYNCAYLPVDDVHAFSESMFLLLGGTGVGYSVQRHHVKNLPPLRGPIQPQDRRYRPKRFLIGDSIEGWADAIKALMNSYFNGTREIEFDYRDIRPKGARLVTSGGKAPGPQPLKDCIHNIKKVLNQVLEGRGANTQLTPLEVHDIMCYIADAVLAGGIRRAAMISLFSFDDEEMRTCKFGNWWELNPQRGRANNSAVAVRHKIQEEDFFDIWGKIKASGSGEPGIYFTNDKDWGTNPCFTGDMKIPLADGKGTIKTFEQLAKENKDVPVYTLNDDGDIVIRNLRGVQITRENEDVYELELDNGDKIRATSDHKFRLKDGSWKNLIELNPGESLWSMSQYEAPLWDNKKSQNYRWINNKGKNNIEHRVIAKYSHGNIKEGQVVHRIDFNALNNDPANLKIMDKINHDNLHGQKIRGNNNPIFKVLNGSNSHSFKQKLSKAARRENNPNYSNMTNEEVRSHALSFVDGLQRLPLKKEWVDYSIKNSIPQINSDYRKNELDSSTELLIWAAVKLGILSEDISNCHPHTLHSFYNWINKGYKVRIYKNRIQFLNTCEITGKIFWSENPYKPYHPSISRSDAMKYFYENHSNKVKRKQALIKAHASRKEQIRDKQVEVYNDLKFRLKRKPLKIEWQEECRENNLSDEISRKSSPFRSYSELKEAASMANHKVVSIKYIGKEDVYDGIVDDFHNFFVTGDLNLSEKTRKGIKKISFVNVANCVEIGLRPFQFCNLTTINATTVKDQEDLNERAKAAAFIGTLQASYTDFHYLRDIWRETTEKDALIGVSMTGIASGTTLGLDLKEAATWVKKENVRVAKKLGINKAARTTAIKPEGCLIKDTMVSTSKGILSLDEIGDIDGDTWQQHDIKVNTDRQQQQSTRFYINGFKPTKRIVLDSGIELESTLNHKFRVITESGEYLWKKAEELELGDLLPYSVGEYNGGEYQSLNQVEFNSSPHAMRTVAINQPKILNEDLAWLLGIYFGDSTNKERSIRIYGNIQEQKGFDRAIKIFKEQFGLEALLKARNSDNPDEKRCHLQVNSKELLNFLAANNLLKQKSHSIEIPVSIRMSPKSVIQAFIDGYQTADGCDKGNNITFSTVSEKFAQQLVVVLRAIGHDAKLRRVSRKAMNVNTTHKDNRESFWVSIRKGRKDVDKSVLRKSTRDTWSKLDALGLTNLSADQIIDIYNSENYTYDLEVDSNDHTYLANSYVSHNTSSLSLGTSSGIHAWHNDYYLRRIRVGKNESIYQYLSIMHPELVEDECFRPDSQAVITVPQKAPQGAILRHETALELLDRVEKVS